MTWNYRILKHQRVNPDGTPEEWLAIHEVYYNSDGEIASYAVEPESFIGEDGEEGGKGCDPQSFRDKMLYIIESALEHEVLVEDQIKFGEWDAFKNTPRPCLSEEIPRVKKRGINPIFLISSYIALLILILLFILKWI